MSTGFFEHETNWRAVVNSEEQYSIWPAGRDLPPGWFPAGREGTRDECLSWIETVWTDMRPRSLREAMASEPEYVTLPEIPDAGPEGPTLDRLVNRLLGANHPVELRLRPTPSAQELRACIERGFVHVCFTETRGQTVLGVRLDPACTSIRADEEVVHLEGALVLNFVAVRCVAEVSLTTWSGVGGLSLEHTQN